MMELPTPKPVKMSSRRPIGSKNISFDQVYTETNFNKTGTSKVGAISKAQNAQNTFF